MLSIRLPEDLEKRLSCLSQATKRSKSYYVREAIERFLEDIEDAYLAETAYEDFLKSGENAVPLNVVERSLDLAD
ncbi:MAG TPA: ribbon-helix-helix protein, CopG family [Desulfobulbus sp.]|nr:ribbon-helix-helix protein, CopG family [Desulfobulbus sp.]